MAAGEGRTLDEYGARLPPRNAGAPQPNTPAVWQAAQIGRHPNARFQSHGSDDRQAPRSASCRDIATITTTLFDGMNDHRGKVRAPCDPENFWPVTGSLQVTLQIAGSRPAGPHRSSRSASTGIDIFGSRRLQAATRRRAGERRNRSRWPACMDDDSAAVVTAAAM